MFCFDNDFTRAECCSQNKTMMVLPPALPVLLHDPVPHEGGDAVVRRGAAGDVQQGPGTPGTRGRPDHGAVHRERDEGSR